MSDYISREDAIEVINQGRLTKLIDADAVESGLKNLTAADVISKTDIITLLEETEREVLKGINRYSPQWVMIDSVFGIIKCKVNMMGEKSNG